MRNEACSLRSAGVLAPALALLVAWSSPAMAEDGDRMVAADALAAMVATPTDGRASREIWSGRNYLLMAAARLVPGTPELHDRMADLFVVQSGAADVLIGGEMKGDAVTAQGERRGGTISGGHVRHVAAGDVLWVPAGAPHKVTPVAGAPFRYLVVKIADRGDGAQ